MLWIILTGVFLYYFRYVLAYWGFYRLSGAHKKPTSDSKHDPQIEHQNSIWYHTVRNMENTMTKELTFKQNTLPVPEIDVSELNPELFQYLTKNKTQPLVIRGLVNGTKAVKLWNSDYFVKNYGDAKILSINKPKGFNAYTSFNQSILSGIMTIGQTIGLMKTNGHYINNVTQIFQEFPELVDDLDLDKIKKIDDAIDSKNWLKINMFMGPKDTGSSLHCAVGGNFFFNIHGKKKWILIDPKYSYALKSTPSNSFSFVISGLDIENSGGTSLQLIPKHEIILEPGDVLYNPPWWWHYVKNIEEFNIGCAIRDHTVYWQSWYNNPMFMFLSPYSWKLNPWFIYIAKIIKGESLRNDSMKSDLSIINDLVN